MKQKRHFWLIYSDDQGRNFVHRFRSAASRQKFMDGLLFECETVTARHPEVRWAQRQETKFPVEIPD